MPYAKPTAEAFLMIEKDGCEQLTKKEVIKEREVKTCV